MKLFKRIRLKLGLFTRFELVLFANNMLFDDSKKKERCVWHADVENFIEDLKTKK